jgi:hypothetical protein
LNVDDERNLIAICRGCGDIKSDHMSIHFCHKCELYLEVADPERVKQIKRNVRRRKQYAADPTPKKKG